MLAFRQRAERTNWHCKETVSRLDNTFEFDKIIKKAIYSKSNLIYDANHIFYKYCGDRKKFHKLSFKSKHSFLNEFFDDWLRSVK